MRSLALCLASAALLALITTAHTQESYRIDHEQEGSPLITSARAEPVAVPPAPVSFVLDQASVFQPEAAARLSNRLTTARTSEVYVFVVTFRTLSVPASKQLAKLELLAKSFAKDWLREKVGAVILFDDEGGLMTVEFSSETDQRFAGFAVEAAVKEPLGKIQQSGIARDKLEQSAYFVADTLIPLQNKWAKDTRRQRIANLIMSTVALLGVGLAVFSALAKPKTPAGTDAGLVVESKPPLDF